MLQDRGALLEGEGDIVREYKAMHEDNLLSSWLRKASPTGIKSGGGSGKARGRW